MNEQSVVTVTCKNCKFWAKLETRAEGECRKYAPKAIMAGGIDGTDYDNDWAVTNADKWCGEFEVAE